MTTKPLYVTPTGMWKLERELETLRLVRRREIAEKLHEIGGISDEIENRMTLFRSAASFRCVNQNTLSRATPSSERERQIWLGGSFHTNARLLSL
jgi:transcription elongation GreA/GreB family factor